MTVDDALKLMAALTPIILAVLTYYTAKANQHAVRAARNAESTADQVATTLARTTDQTAAKLNSLTNGQSSLREGQGEIHKLVNNQLTEAVERVKQAAAEIAELKRLLSEATGLPAPPSPP